MSISRSYRRLQIFPVASLACKILSPVRRRDAYHTGARGVVVIAVGNEHGDTSSNPGRD